MACSIVDVARRVGTSKSTVSRVLNGGSVSETTKAAVLAAINQMEYYPNGMARGLRGIKSRVIGVVAESENTFESPMLVRRMAGISRICIENGYSILMIVPTPNAKDGIVANAFRFLQENRVDGACARCNGIFYGQRPCAEKRFFDCVH